MQIQQNNKQYPSADPLVSKTLKVFCKNRA